MIITDTQIVNDSLKAILAKDSMIAVDAEDIARMFGENPQLQMMKIAGDIIEEVVLNLKEGLSEMGGCPQKYFAAYVSMTLRMQDLEMLSEITASAAEYKRTIIFETEPEGEIVLYYFFSCQ